MKTRSIRFHETGGPEVLRIEALEVGEPGPGEVRVRIEAIGLNRAEAAFRAGRYLEPPQLPARLGYEAAGVVEAVGEGVTTARIGQAVCVIPTFSMNKYGVYAERAIVPAFAVLRRPEGLNAVTSAAVWMQYLTAYGALIDIARLKAGDTVVITAASSSVGLAAIQLANHVGAIPIAVTRSAAKATALRTRGAAHVIVTEEQDLVAEVLRITEQKGARIAFDPIAGPMVAPLATVLGPQGILIPYGNLSGGGPEAPMPFFALLGKGLTIRGFLVFELIHDPRRFPAARAFIENALLTGALEPVIDRTFAFEQIVDAHRYLESNQQVGKVVVTVP